MENIIAPCGFQVTASGGKGYLDRGREIAGNKRTIFALLKEGLTERTIMDYRSNGEAGQASRPSARLPVFSRTGYHVFSHQDYGRSPRRT
jgi:hypothetical protein